VVHACNPRKWEKEVQVFKASLGYIVRQEEEGGEEEEEEKKEKEQKGKERKTTIRTSM
jgi:hypothetical protein